MFENLRHVEDFAASSLQRQLYQAQRDTIETAMWMLYPEVAADGFENYASRLAAAYWANACLVMLDAVEGQPPTKPVVYLPAPHIKEPTVADNTVKMGFSFIPIEGIRGLEAFRRMQASTPGNFEFRW